MIVAFIGAIGAGKTTAAQALHTEGYVPVNFSDPLREALEILDPIVGRIAELSEGDLLDTDLRYKEAVHLFGYRKAKDKYPEIRRLMQKIGTELARENWGQDFWVDLWTKRVQDHSLVTVDDLRFPNELTAVRQAGSYPLVIRVKRPGLDVPADDHPSEQHWHRFAPDAVVYNEGSVDQFQADVRATVAVLTPSSDPRTELYRSFERDEIRGRT